MHTSAVVWLLFGFAALSAAAWAGQTLEVRDARALATVPGQRVAAAYLTLESPSAARLEAASSDAAASVQIHEMSTRDGIMRMRRLDSVELPAGREVRLVPGGTHLMLTGLKRRLQPGDTVELMLTVSAPGKSAHIERVRLPVVEARAGSEHHD